MDEFYISPKDREVLRELAKKQLELSQAEKNKKRIGEWYEHNSLQGKRPMKSFLRGLDVKESSQGR